MRIRESKEGRRVRSSRAARYWASSKQELSDSDGWGRGFVTESGASLALASRHHSPTFARNTPAFASIAIPNHSKGLINRFNRRRLHSGFIHLHSDIAVKGKSRSPPSRDERTPCLQQQRKLGTLTGHDIFSSPTHRSRQRLHFHHL